MRVNVKGIWVAVGALVLLYFLIGQVTSLTAVREVSTATDSLMKEIEEKAAEYNELPKDAYIDRVWKKTPGRNGRKVHIKKSYKKMKKANKFDASKLVFEPVAPEISLADLPASPIFRGHPDKQMVALQINVSWGTERIPGILKVLADKEVKATFYIEGKWAKENKEVLKMMEEEGHMIANHAYNHPDMATLTKVEMREQIEETNEIIEAIIGKRPTYFAPPSGSYNAEVVEVASKLDMETIMWTVDTIDWRKPSVSVMIDRVMTKIHPGAIILMHPTEPVELGLEQLIDEIKAEELEIGTIDKLLNEAR